MNASTCILAVPVHSLRHPWRARPLSECTRVGMLTAHTHARTRAHGYAHMRACTQSQAHTHAHIQAESLTKLFPAGSALAKVFEAQELKEKEKAQELKEKEEAREFKEKKREEEVKQRLDILSLAVGILVFVLLAQSHGFGGALNTVFKSVLRI